MAKKVKLSKGYYAKVYIPGPPGAGTELYGPYSTKSAASTVAKRRAKGLRQKGYKKFRATALKA